MLPMFKNIHLITFIFAYCSILISKNTSIFSSAEIETTDHACITDDDLDMNPSCTLEKLPISALKSICQRIGLDVETYMFPYMFGEEDDGEDETKTATATATATEMQSTKFKAPIQRTKEDYIEAAKQCLDIEEEIDRMVLEDPEALIDLEREIWAEDAALLADIVADVLSHSPDLVEELEEELKTDDPELFEEIIKELNEGERLADRPDILAEVVALMLEEDPELFEQLGGDIEAMLMANESDEMPQNGQMDEARNEL